MSNNNKSITTYFSFYFLYYFSVASLFSLFSVYLGDHLNLSNGKVGIIISIMSITSIFVQPFWGVVSDITKKTKTIIMLALVVSIITSIIFLFISSFTALFINFLFMSIFYAAIIPLSDTMSLNFVSKHKCSSFGTIRSFGSIGYAVGALFIGLVTQSYGIQWIFIIFSIFMFFTLLLAFKLDSSISTKKTSFKKDFKALVKIPNYWILILFVFIFIGALFGPTTYLNLYIKQKFGSLWIIGIIYFLMAGIEMPFMLQFNKLIKKLNPWAIMLVCSILSTIRLYALAFDSNIFIFTIICISQSIVLGFGFPTLLYIVNQLVPQGVLSTSVTIYNAIGFGSSKLIFGIIAGFLADAHGYPQMFKIFSVISTVGILIGLYLLILNERKKHLAKG